MPSLRHPSLVSLSLAALALAVHSSGCNCNGGGGTGGAGSPGGAGGGTGHGGGTGGSGGTGTGGSHGTGGTRSTGTGGDAIGTGGSAIGTGGSGGTGTGGSGGMGGTKSTGTSGTGGTKPTGAGGNSGTGTGGTGTGGTGGACGGAGGSPSCAPGSTVGGPVSATDMGLVTGGIYAPVPGQLQSLVGAPGVIGCEYRNLGVKWIRIEADWSQAYPVDGGSASHAVTPAEYQTIVQEAHGVGIKVLVVVTANEHYCGSDVDRQAVKAFTKAYTDHLDDLVAGVFTGAAAVDAFEITNEPNMCDGCPVVAGPGPDGGASCGPDAGPDTNQCTDKYGKPSRFRTGPQAFAQLMRDVWEWKQSNQRSELIVSGGLVNSYVMEGYWMDMLGAPGYADCKGSRPFDYFGVHPYDSKKKGSTDDNFSAWDNEVAAELPQVAVRVDQATGVSGTQLFVTEIGWQWHAPSDPLCSTGFDDNCVTEELSQADGLSAAFDAITKSKVVPVALWYNYRDDDGSGSERFGIRTSTWGARAYTAKPDVWCRLWSVGNQGSPPSCPDPSPTSTTNPDSCWYTGS